MDFEVNEERYSQTRWLISILRSEVMLKTMALELQREFH
jgi:hypothetical protein